MEHRPRGRLFSFDPATGKTTLLVEDLYYANGVAVSPDGAFVLVNETGAYRIQRHWLSGPKRGETEIFIDNLPGFPDGISSTGTDLFWLTLVSPRNDMADTVLMPKPFLRTLMMRLPSALLPKAQAYGFVLGLSADGTVIHNLQDPSGSFAQISSVEEYDGMLYFGSLVEDAVGRLPVPER
jgi:hypothetical protein